MKLFIAFISVCALALHSQECRYSIDKKDIAIVWHAFKTPKKVGVRGEFKKFDVALSGSQKESIYEYIKDKNFVIDTNSVETNLADRNKKIVKHFFGVVSDQKIHGKIIEADEDEVLMEIKINGISQKVPLQVTKSEMKSATRGIIETEGYIDVLDFSLAKGLAAINQACLALHEGKTWNDVKISLQFQYTKNTCGK